MFRLVVGRLSPQAGTNILFHMICALLTIQELRKFPTMNNLTDIKKTGLNKLEWSSTSFQVSEFLKKFPLPQIVKVIEGYYGEDEESSLGADQVMTLHVVKSAEKIVGRDCSGKEVNIPLNCSSKVEVRPSNLKDVYESVDELCSAFPQFVRISQGYYSISKDEEILNVGDKLQLKNIDKSKKGQERLVCVNQNGQTVELPRDCIAGFQPLADGKEYYLAEIPSQFTLPLYVQFVDPPTVGKLGRSANEEVFNSSLGCIYLEKKYIDNVAIASTVSSDGLRTVVTFPLDMDIRVAVCEGMLQNSTNYAQICQSLNDGMDLTSLRHIDAHSAFRPRNSIKEYSYQELVTCSTPRQTRAKEESTTEPGQLPEADVETEVDQTTIEENGTNQLPKENGVFEYRAGQKADSVSHKKDNSQEKAFTRKAPPKPQRMQNSPVVKDNESTQPSKSDESKEAATGVGTAPSLQTIDAESPDLKVNENATDLSNPKVYVTTLRVNQPSTKKAPDVSGFSVKQVGDILRELGMEMYVVKFEAEMIDGEMLTFLNDDILRSDFGMNKLHCMKLRKYLEGWRPKV